ncbi:MAG: rRNA maturation RNase YbeY [Pseudomonadota bacterium]
MRAGGRTKFSLSVQYASQARELPTRQQFRRWVGAALSPSPAGGGVGAREKCQGGGGARPHPLSLSLRERERGENVEAAQITLRIVDEDEGRMLNRDYRGKDYATNVLTFAYGEEDGVLAGDIVLCAPVVEKEARGQGKELRAHYAHLTVHGVLHMQGFDHESEAEAREMEAREVEILRRLRFNDPYASEKSQAVQSGVGI